MLGFVRDAMIAWCFGTGFGSDAFLAAFRIPNLFRRLFGEGALSSAFVPVLTETLGQPRGRSLAAAALAAGRPADRPVPGGHGGLPWICG
jgi:putative peptidoglycan lipid II flippase